MTIHITLIPQRRDDSYSLSVAGEVLTIDGAALDLSVIPEGAALPAGAVSCPWIAGPIRREDGDLHLSMILPHGPIPWPAPPDALAVTHPARISIATDGPVVLPAWTEEAAQ